MPDTFRTAILVGALVASLPGVATAAPYAYTMDGDAYVKMLVRSEPLNSYDYMEREKAYSYLDGLKDGTHGRIWCDVDELKTPDLAYALADEISRLRPAERKRSAAVLMLDILQRKFPCPRGKS